MISIISPAKTLDFKSSDIKSHSFPDFKEESLFLIEKLRKKSARSLIKLMGISKNQAEQNAERFHTFSPLSKPENSKQAILTFKGDVYRGIDVEDFTEEELQFAQSHVRILSGLYGILKPLDLIQPYRLEMGTQIKLGRKNNLYEYWDLKLTNKLNELIAQGNHQTLLNLASKEYFNALKHELIKAKIVDIHFREYRNDTLKFLSYNAKKARGMMIRYIVKNKIGRLEDVKGFNLENYTFDESLSSDSALTFTR